MLFKYEWEFRYDYLFRSCMICRGNRYFPLFLFSIHSHILGNSHLCLSQKSYKKKNYCPRIWLRVVSKIINQISTASHHYSMIHFHPINSRIKRKITSFLDTPVMRNCTKNCLNFSVNLSHLT